MYLKNLINIRFRFYFIPNSLGIDHHGRPEFAAVQAARHIHPHPGQAQLLCTRLHVIAQALTTARRAGAALMAIRPPIAADEDMRLKMQRRISQLLRLSFHLIHGHPPYTNSKRATA